MEDSQSNSSVFSVRIVSIDYYMAPPIPDLDFCYSSFQGGKVNEVPVIRIYGSTPAGQKTCLHIHRALPYLYVPCSDIVLQPGDAHAQVISFSVEKALKLKGSAGLKRQHVHGCSLVRARRFYGYDASEELFAKIYLYYPQDVSRASNLLLGGTVLEKGLQPHESHIPFLLQFLVDYNLYGMGHLHVSKMKFRHPIPDSFSLREPYYNRQFKQQTDNSRMATDFQADSRGDGCLSSPIWLSSTIPDSWIWQFPSQDQDNHLVKRQSACGLEGDAVVDDILNQQCKLYLPFSQTLLDVRMVQSLIPIWEELERTGMQSSIMPPDPGKPLPEDVLRTLSHGLEFGNKLKELCSEADNSSPCTPFENRGMFLQSMRASIDGRNAVDLGHAYPEVGTSKHLKSSKENDKSGPLLSQDSPCGDDDTYKAGDRRDELHLPTDELQLSNTGLPSNLKVADQEALRLLKWLASSQAAEDINSDDELIRETILSPLLPATTINKVLEKADMEYESASQQECQDILDSVEDSTEVEGKNQRASQSRSLDDGFDRQLSSKEKIPQADCSSDDQNLTPCVSKTSKIEANSESEKSMQDQIQNDSGPSLSRKQKRKGPLWSSLPFSWGEKVNEHFQPMSVSLTGRSDHESKDGIGACSWEENEAGTCSDVVMVDAVNDTCLSKVKNTIVGCSVRDLMRRKRSQRGEPPECSTLRDRKVISEEKSKEDLFSCRKWRSNGQDIEAISIFSSSRSSFIDESTDFHEGNMNAGTSKVEVHHEGFDVKLNTSLRSVYGKLPLFTGDDSSMPMSTFNDGRIISHEGVDGLVVAGEAAGSRNFNITGLSSVHGGTGNLPHILNFDNQNSAHEIEHCEKYGNELSGNCLIGIRPLGSEFHTCQPALHHKMSRYNGNDELLGIGNLLQTDFDGSGSLSTCPVERKICEKDSCISKGCYNRTTSMQGVLGTSPENLRGTEMRTGTALMQSDTGFDVPHGRDAGISHPSSSASMGVNMEVDTVESVALSFCKKPPVIQWSCEPSRDASLPTVIPGFPCPADDVYSRDVDECLPFFEGGYLEGKEVQDTGCRINDFNNHRERFMGVPIHYHNDGSCLYMLTPAFLPPSTEGVHRWLLYDDILSENVNDASVESSSPKGPFGDLVNSQGLLSDACDEPLPDSGSIFNAEPILDQVNKQNQESHVIEHPFPTGAATVLQTEGNILELEQRSICSQDISQISGPDGKSKLTPLSQTGFRDPASVGGGQQLTLLSIEVQPESRGDLRPDPRFDAVNLIVLVIQEDDDFELDAYVLLRSDTDSVKRNLDGSTNCKLLVSSEEKHLFYDFMKIICSFDPDILMGWDIQGGSLGFLAERAAHLGIGLLNDISRTPSQPNITTRDTDIPEKGIVSDVLPESIISDSVLQKDSIIEDEWGRTHASGVHVGGRIVLNVWRLIRSEVKLNMYTAEAVAEAVLRRKIPSLHSKILTKWYASGPGRARYRCIEYILVRAKLNLQIMNQLDMINRTSELARVFGIDYFSVLSRGSQYRVESMLLRLAHTQNYLAISPGSQQVASQPAMECLPLVMEPESGFYADPVVVLDFQSLYPSMIIAYNLCFSTCLGKVTPSKPNTLGVSSYVPDPNVLQDLKNEILLTPNAVMYVPSKVHKGVLPRLLDEILSTRIMVKQAMKKLAPSQQVLHRIYNARQLALKLIANVTYGYTAAGFSGRMPCAELADSIVQCGRRTLENAISLVNTNDKWKARVIYGDTDSMFVLLQGRSVSESFQIGHEIAAAVTAMNPNPVTLKMEKVYHPCFLLTKKRYVGYSYEKPDQVKPVFDAKGIETVRRDTCGAVSKTMEQSLRLFFEHQDIDKVKSYLLRQWTRILSGRVSLQDFVFAKEVRLGTYSTRVSSLPPAAIVAIKAMRSDPRAEPLYAERIPYVVVHGEPGARLVDMVVEPLDLLAVNSPFRLNDLYYINKQIIPALQRVFGLVGVDLNQWFLDMPRPVREAVGKRQAYAPNLHRTRIDYYYLSKHCIMCGELVKASALLCGKCFKNEASVAVAVTGRTAKLEREMEHLAAICRHCGGGDWLVESGVKCTSLACSVFYERQKVQKELQSLSFVATESGFYPRCMVEWF